MGGLVPGPGKIRTIPLLFIATGTAKYSTSTRAAHRGVELLLISYHDLSSCSSNDRGVYRTY